MTETLPPSSVEAQLESSLQKIGIPPRPVILDKINAEMHKDEPDFNQLARIIAADVALSASLINITNSPYFGFRGRVNSPREALMMLGLNVASKAIAGIVMRKAFPKSPQLERFWDASARIARLSGWLAQRVTKSTLRADDAYTFGLFRDCGIPILLSRHPGYFDILTEANHEASRSFTTVEETTLPTNHAVVGYMLAQSWWLPDETILSIRHHHDVAILDTPSIPPTLHSRYLIAVSQLAEYLLQQHSGLSFTQEWGKLGPACLRLLNLTEDDVQELLTEATPIIEAED
ncbi:MAG: HDOD domain-containing protein [Gallionella sp.]|nr:HDOD domain-containing protein [Gallionella sp.]